MTETYIDSVRIEFGIYEENNLNDGYTYLIPRGTVKDSFLNVEYLFIDSQSSSIMKTDKRRYLIE